LSQIPKIIHNTVTIIQILQVMAERTSLYMPNKSIIYGLNACAVPIIISILLFPVYAQSDGLKVIVDNERESGEVCVFSESDTILCKYLNIGGSEEFQFAPNTIPVGEEFQVCLEDFCVTDSNSPTNEPEHVILSISDLEEAQPTDTNQPPQQETDDSEDSRSVPILILLIAVAAVIGIVIKKLPRNKKREERHDFPDSIKERVLRKQNHRCANCKRLLNVVDWDHKNRKRYDNGESNCQALCPNCHAIKTRTRR
jgi:hypothetical protein